MKKYLIVFLILKEIIGFGQFRPEHEHVQDLILKPEVSELFKFDDIQGINANGQFQYNVGVFTIKNKRFSIPINLTYTNRSLNPLQFAPNYGHGWFLSGEGAIKRTVKGQRDFIYWKNGFANNSHVDWEGNPTGENCYHVGWFNHDTYNSTHAIDIEDMDYERKYLIHNIDNEPDVFHCTGPGLDVKFAFTKDKQPFIIEGDEVTFTKFESGK